MCDQLEQGSVPVLRKIKNCCWYENIKGITPDQEVENEAVFLFDVQRFLKQDWKKFDSVYVQYLSDLIQLMLFIDKECFGYSADKNINKCIDLLAQGRNKLNTKEKECLDKQMKECVNKISEYAIILNIFTTYFTTMDDIAFLKDYLQKHKGYRADSLLEEWIENNQSDEQLLEICSGLSSTRAACKWLSSYYVRIKQLKKAIQVLENYCNTNQKKDCSEEQIALVNLYGKNHDKMKRDSLFQTLLKNYHVDKEELFCSLKEGMSAEEWNTQGKDMVLQWAMKQDEDTSYQVYVALDAGDLFLTHLVEKGFNFYALSDYGEFLANMDVGVYFSLLKITIVRELENAYSYMQMYNYEDLIPKKLLHSDAMKYILLELQDEYKNDPVILRKLDLLEEKLYES